MTQEPKQVEAETLDFGRAYFERGFMAAYAWRRFTYRDDGSLTDAVVDHAWEHRDEGMDEADMLPVRLTSQPALADVEGGMLSAENCGAVSDDAIRHLEIRDQLNRAIYRALRVYRMSNMSEADDSLYPYPLVDLMSNPAPADIGTGEMEMIALADEIAAAVRTLSTPQSETEKLREALLMARSWITHSPECSIHSPIATDDGFREECSCSYSEKVSVIDRAALAEARS